MGRDSGATTAAGRRLVRGRNTCSHRAEEPRDGEWGEKLKLYQIVLYCCVRCLWNVLITEINISLAGGAVQAALTPPPPPVCIAASHPRPGRAVQRGGAGAEIGTPAVEIVFSTLSHESWWADRLTASPPSRAAPVLSVCNVPPAHTGFPAFFIADQR